jgi:hypothetical protein
VNGEPFPLRQSGKVLCQQLQLFGTSQVIDIEFNWRTALRRRPDKLVSIATQRTLTFANHALGNSHDPGTESFPIAELAQVVKRSQKRVLCHIFHRGVVATGCTHDRANHWRMAIEQAGKRLVVARQRLRHQFRVCGVVLLHTQHSSGRRAKTVHAVLERFPCVGTASVEDRHRRCEIVVSLSIFTGAARRYCRPAANVRRP